MSKPRTRRRQTLGSQVLKTPYFALLTAIGARALRHLRRAIERAYRIPAPENPLVSPTDPHPASNKRAPDGTLESFMRFQFSPDCNASRWKDRPKRPRSACYKTSKAIWSCASHNIPNNDIFQWVFRELNGHNAMDSRVPDLLGVKDQQPSRLRRRRSRNTSWPAPQFRDPHQPN
jgi:hypothetical protein